MAWQDLLDSTALTEHGTVSTADHPRIIYPSSGQVIQFPPAAGGATAALTGSATASIDEADIRAGTKEIIITLTGDTFVTSPSSQDGIARGGDSDKTGANKWDSLIKTNLDNADVVLSVGDTVATITLPAYGTYDTDEQETITWTIPAASLTTSAIDVTVTPTFTVDVVATGVSIPIAMYHYQHNTGSHL